ncbi:MAG: TIGR01777 family oxidoreductase [Pseudomonadales bacterium]
MNILITGASGLIGTALTKAFTANGHSVYAMARDSEQDSINPQPFYWQPKHKMIRFDTSVKIDIVINLAGENIADRRWTANSKAKFWQSRIDSTRLLAEALATLEHKPALFISGSAIGFYGDTGDTIVDERSEAGNDFLAQLSVAWEQATAAASESGIRTVHLRTGIVLSPNGGALQRMLLPFKLGLGGALGNGQQYMSCISLYEAVKIIQFIISRENIQGAVNVVSPEAVTNRTFTKTLGAVLKRPTFFTITAPIARFVFGEMADHLLLSGARVKPSVLIEHGYKFNDNNLSAALERSLLKPSN